MWFLGTEQTVSRVQVATDGAPIFVRATAGKEQATIEWMPPPSPPASPIICYDVLRTGGAFACQTTGALSCTVTGLIPSQPYAFQVRPMTAAGPGALSGPSNEVVPWSGSGYHPVQPVRILDSRLPDVGFSGRVTAATPRSLQVTGRGGPSNVPASATAVVMNVTVTDSTAESFLTVYPTGSPTPLSSNLNFGAGQVIPNLVTVPLGTGGKVDLATAVGSTNVVADVVGYYDDGVDPGDRYHSTAPVRLLDSRTNTGGWSGKLPAGAPRDLVVRRPANPSGVPAAATAVIANVTVTDGSEPSFVTAWPSGTAQPGVSNLNLSRGQTIANLAIVPIGANGAIRLANAVGSVHVIVDVVGWFEPRNGSLFHPMAPTRVLDTRNGTGGSNTPLGPGATLDLAVAGAAGIDVSADATGLVANVTVADATAESFVAVFPGGTARPVPFSNLNFGRNQVIPNLTTVGMDRTNGTVSLYNHLGETEVIVDAVGWYARW
jgi:hypothetical protein